MITTQKTKKKSKKETNKQAKKINNRHTLCNKQTHICIVLIQDNEKVRWSLLLCLQKRSKQWNVCLRFYSIPAGIYLFKVNNRNTRTRREICSKLTINTPERRQWRRSGVFIVNFEHISHLVLVFLLLTLSR